MGKDKKNKKDKKCSECGHSRCRCNQNESSNHKNKESKPNQKKCKKCKYEHCQSESKHKQKVKQNVELYVEGGYIGFTGLNGITGATGEEGAAGASGEAGATGTTGAGLSVYGYIYNLIAETVAIEADITFDSNGLITPGITHAPGTPQILVTTPGDYEVTFSVSGVEPNQFALFLNGALVAGTVYGSGAGTQETNGQVLVTIAAGDVLTVRNHSSASAVTLQTLAGGTQTNTNASVILKKLN